MVLPSVGGTGSSTLFAQALLKNSPAGVPAMASAKVGQRAANGAHTPLQSACKPEPGGSACCYWNGYGTQFYHPAQGLTEHVSGSSPATPHPGDASGPQQRAVSTGASATSPASQPLTGGLCVSCSRQVVRLVALAS